MYLSIIIIPLLGSIVSGLLGRKVGVTGSKIITCTSLIISSFLITIAFYEVGICNSPVSINIISWLDIELLSISWYFYFDQLTVSLGLAVLYCSTLIHIYSVDYLSTDPHNQRFFSYLSAFTGGMLILICGGNFFVMFVGWEAIGVVSYLLINFYFTRIQSNKAAMLAFTMNRGGDMLMSIGFFSIFSIFGSLNYSEVFTLVPYLNETAITIIALLLLGGALAKSANIPLHSWLPGSMEAPTPVSALLHAATLVTAGIYLLIRISPILEFSGCVLLQNDLKRIIAFSTISQLGYMMMAIGLSQYNVALMHTVNHAFFKALLFLGAGAVIHSFADQQDIRRMGGLIKFLPFTYSVMLTGSLSLLATPYLTGFYSKDLILELAYGQYSFSGMYAFILGSITAGITAFYSFRLISLVFLTTANGQKESYLNSHESKLATIIPLLILAIFSIFFGFIFSDLFVGIGNDFFANSIFTHPNNIALVEAEFSLNPIIKLLPAILSLFGASLVIFMYHIQPQILINLTFDSLPSLPRSLPSLANATFVPTLWVWDQRALDWSKAREAKGQWQQWHPNKLGSAGSANSINYIGKSIYTFLNGKYFFDAIYNQYLVTNGLKLGYTISKEIDRGAIELLGPYGLSNYLNNTGKNLAKLDTGIITTYSLYITLGLLALLFLVFAPLFFNTYLLEGFRLFIIYFASAFFILSPALRS